MSTTGLDLPNSHKRSQAASGNELQLKTWRRWQTDRQTESVAGSRKRSNWERLPPESHSSGCLSCLDRAKRPRSGRKKAKLVALCEEALVGKCWSDIEWTTISSSRCFCASPCVGNLTAQQTLL
eukprot:1752391-Amphidinium_carterae.1